MDNDGVILRALDEWDACSASCIGTRVEVASGHQDGISQGDPMCFMFDAHH